VPGAGGVVASSGEICANKSARGGPYQASLGLRRGRHRRFVEFGSWGFKETRDVSAHLGIVYPGTGGCRREEKRGRNHRYEFGFQSCGLLPLLAWMSHFWRTAEKYGFTPRKARPKPMLGWEKMTVASASKKSEPTKILRVRVFLFAAARIPNSIRAD